MESNGNSPSWQETKAGKRIWKKLNDEQTLESLDHLLQRIQILEGIVERLSTLIERAPGLLQATNHIADKTIGKINEEKVNLEERFEKALHLAGGLPNPGP